MPYTKTHIKIINDKIYDIEALIKLVKNRKSIRVKLPKANRSSSTGFSKKRYKETNVKFPILILNTGELIDGRHRVLKLKDKGYFETQAIIITKEDLKIVEIRT